jgi:hypothetical protein
MRDNSLITQNNCVNFACSHLCWGFSLQFEQVIFPSILLLPTLNVSFILRLKVTTDHKLENVLTIGQKHFEEFALGFIVRRPGRNKETGGVQVFAQTNAI